MNTIPLARSRIALSTRKNQSGMLLIEALFAILVFSLGILALIGFQASAIRASSEARSRSDATMIANQVVSDIWTGNHSAANMINYVGIYNTTATTWGQQVIALLPASSVTVAVSNGISDGVSATKIVDVTVKWQAPGDPAQHNLAVSTQIN